MTPSRTFAAAFALGALAVSGCAAPPAHRYFQPSADQIGPYPNSFGEAVIPRGGLIVVQGDELAYGQARRGGRREINGAPAALSSITISETLRAAVKGVRVENRGYPGDTVVRSAARWADAPAPDLAILAFGFGDASAHTSLTDFSIALAIVIQGLQAHGATVFVVIPPTVSDPLRNAALTPYRLAATLTARRANAVVFNASDPLVRLKLKAAKGDAQPAALYQGVAADIVPYIKVVAGSPQTAHAGSGDSRTVRDSPARPS